MAETRIMRFVDVANRVTIEGEYTKTGWGAWSLTRWRLGTFSVDGKNTKHSGDWHKVHGNQKRDLGALKLLIERGHWPERAQKPDPFYFWTEPTNEKATDEYKNTTHYQMLSDEDKLVYDGVVAQQRANG